MAFHDIRFPANLSFGSVGGPERRTEIVTLANGFEERNTPWAHSRRRYDAGLGLRSLDDVETLIAFFEARGGQLHGFRWKDWSDYKSCAPSAVAGAGGPADRHRRRGDNGLSAAEDLSVGAAKPMSARSASRLLGTVLVAIEGDREGRRRWSSRSMSQTGEVTFTLPPEAGDPDHGRVRVRRAGALRHRPRSRPRSRRSRPVRCRTVPVVEVRL